MILGLLKPTKGKILIDGVDIRYLQYESPISWTEAQRIFYSNDGVSVFDISAPVVGSNSIPSGVIFLGSGVNVDSGLSL